jgi:hypothetical protein
MRENRPYGSEGGEGQKPFPTLSPFGVAEAELWIPGTSPGMTEQRSDLAWFKAFRWGFRRRCEPWRWRDV